MIHFRLVGSKSLRRQLLKRRLENPRQQEPDGSESCIGSVDPIDMYMDHDVD